MKRKILNTTGLALMSLPATKTNKNNNKHRNIRDMDYTTSAHMISVTGINPEEPLIFCGKHNKAFHIIRQLVKKSSKPFVLLGTKRDLNEESCFQLLNTEWELNSTVQTLPKGNGIMLLKPCGDTYLELYNYITEWDSHLIILCVGNGLQVDQELLNLLNSIGHYILLSENLQRSVKSSEGNKLEPSNLLSMMDYIIVSSVGTAGKDLLKVLPDFECEKITNTTDLSLHKDTPDAYKDDHHRNGRGLRFSQSKSLESRCVLTQDVLTRMQDSNMMVIYNANRSHIWVAKITA